MTRALNYYRNLLNQYLLETNPELAKDEQFLDSRSDRCYAMREKLFMEGIPLMSIDEIILDELFSGLRYSRYSVIRQIITNDFPEIIPEQELTGFILKLLPSLEPIFIQYPENDNFNVDSDGWEAMVMELSGKIRENLN